MSTQPQPTPETAAPAADSNANIVHVIYALMALGFITGITWIAAIILCYVKRADLAGTYLESHISWNIKTFWWSLGGSIIGILLSFVLIGIPLLIALAIWIIYRIAKGWLRLSEKKAVD